jgi:hypothetical protein
VDLADALALVLMLAKHGYKLFSRAAVRWVSRYCVEVEAVELQEARAVLAAVAGLPDAPAVAALEAVLRARGRQDLADVVQQRAA